MLDIKYFKQIDEILEVEGFDLKSKDFISYLWHLNHQLAIQFKDDDVFSDIIYPLYLQRVCDRIQQEIDQRFIVRCNSKDTSKWFFRYSTATGYNESVNFDSKIECQEIAIIYIMDHIKEKV